ncbi:MAG: DUF1993 domain-containing protein, partial [Nannocystaceae bacterium]
YDPVVLLTSRLAPDQYPLTRQVQIACDSAKFAGARLTGKDAPKHEDTETTYEQLTARITSTIEYLNTLVAADFEGCEDKTVELPFLPGKGVKGSDYLKDFVLPNFYFHATTAYAILRHNGIDVGKRDYIGSMPLFDVATPAS